jgi:hypothetical protein
MKTEERIKQEVKKLKKEIKKDNIHFGLIVDKLNTLKWVLNDEDV